MALQQTGVELVAQNEAGFLAALNRANSAVAGFGKGATGILSPLSSITGGLLNFSNTATQTEQSVGGLNISTLALGTAFGNLAAGAITNAWQSMVSFSTGAIQAAGAIQDLQINLETLTSREIMFSGMTNELSESLAMAKPKAAELLEQLKNLSIASPFQYKQIAEVFNMNMAFGQTSDMAMELTRAITNLGAVNKGIPGILQRLSYNFSQMSMVGKITSRDVRDLAMAGLDLKKVLELQLGMTLKEVNSAMESGALTFKDVAQALVDYTDKYIGPAAARASRTLGGLMSTLGDVSFFASAQLFKPAVDIVTGSLGNLLDRALLIINSEAFTKIGAGLAAVADELIKLSGVADMAVKTADEVNAAWSKGGYEAAIGAAKAYNAQQDALDDMTNGWLEAGEAALRWGVEVMANFAEGLIQGASEALTASMDFISGILEYFLAPGSPPRVAPNLDKWGAEAMTEYMRGWENGDFSVFDSIQGTLESYIRALPSVATSDDRLGVLGSIMGERAGLAEAINMVKEAGAVTEDAVDKAMKGISDKTPELREFVRLSLESEVQAAQMAKAQQDLAAASQGVASAQQELNDVSSYYDSILEALNAQLSYQTGLVDEKQRLQKIEEALATGRLTDAERERLIAEKGEIQLRRSIKDVEYEKKLAEDAAQAKIDAAQDEYNAAYQQAALIQAQIDSTNELLSVQKELVSQQIESNKLLSDYLKEQQRLADEAARESEKEETGEETKPEVPEAAIEMPDIPTDSIAKKFEELKASMKEKFFGEDGIFSPISTAIDNLTAEGGPLSNLTQSWQRLADNLNNIYTTYIKPIFDTIFPSDAEGGKNAVAKSIDEIIGFILGIIVPAMLIASIIGLVFSPTGLIAIALIAGGIIWAKYGDQIKETMENAKKKIEDAVNAAKPKLEEIKSKLSEMASVVLPDLGKAWDNLTSKFGAGAFEDIIASFADLQESFSVIGTVLTGLGTLAAIVFSPLIVSFQLFVENIGSALGMFVDIVTLLVDASLGPLKVLGATVKAIFDSIVAIVTGDKDAFIKVWGDWFSRVSEIGFQLKAQVLKIFQDMSDSVSTVGKEFVDKIVAYFKWLYDELVGNSIIPDMLSDIYDVFTRILDNVAAFIGQWVAARITQFLQFLTDTYNNFSQKTEEIKTLVTTWLAQLVEAITGKAQQFYDAAKNLITRVGNAFSDMQGWIGDTLTNVINGAIQAVTNLANSLYDIGVNLIQNLGNGASSMVGWLGGIISGIVSSAVSAAQQAAAGLAAAVSGGTTNPDPATQAGPPPATTTTTPPPATTTTPPVGISSITSPTVSQPATATSSSGGSTSIFNTTNVNVNPTYTGSTSPSMLYYDVSAALGAAKV